MPANQTLTITAPRSGANFLPAVKDHIESLWKVSTLRATSVGGTSAAITATVLPDFSALYEGMSFFITFPVAPASNATLNVSATGAKLLARADGSAILTGDVQASTYLVAYIGGRYRVLALAPIPRAGLPGAPQTTITRTSLMPYAVGAEAAASKFGGTGSGTWRLCSKTANKAFGYSDSIICLIVRIR